MDIHNDIATWLASHSITAYAGFAPADRGTSEYVVVSPVIEFDNGEFSTGTCKVKKGTIDISIYGKGTIQSLGTTERVIRRLLAVRQIQMTEHFVNGMFLHGVFNDDQIPDPHGRETGLPQKVLTYTIGFRRTASL